MEISSELGILMLLFCISGYTMLAKRLSQTVITAPIIFLSIGFILASLGIFTEIETEEIIHLVAEIALIVLLFLDASQINLKRLKHKNTWPLRMLLIGLPLCIVIGTLVGLLFFPEWPWLFVALVASVLAPTDAALGEAVIQNKSVPVNTRQTLTVESGLNDGLALPFVLFFASLFLTVSQEDTSTFYWLFFGASQVTIGVVVGITMGWMSGKLFLYAESKELTSNVYEGIGVLALSGSSYLFATVVGGNGFISAFVAGLVFGNQVKGHCRFIYQFTETEGQLLVWAAFTAIGLGLLPEALHHITWNIALYILVSLFFVRPLAIYLSLLGAKMPLVSKLFLGWFGPRGLATALFALIVSKDMLSEYSHSLLVVAINAVWISALLHGMSAAPLGRWYGTYMLKLKQRRRNN
ncbi:MAG: cation:proton antiporter [Paraglaciecola sp.]|uniref:cation:proton antiporter n=1 Tax=Paraglaciecola sp. TaxID=1920173 RepID=UPI0032973F08